MSYYLLTIGFTALFILALSIAYIIQNYKFSGSYFFLLVLIGMFIWSFSYFLELSAADIENALKWFKFKHIGKFLIPSAFFLFSISFENRLKNININFMILISVIPFVTVYALFSRFFGNMMFESFSYGRGITPEYGIIYYFHLFVSYILMVSGFIIFCKNNKTNYSIHKRLCKYITFSVFIPASFNIISIVSDIIPSLKYYIQYDLTVPSFLLSGVFIIITFIKSDYMRYKPVARDIVFEKISDGIIVLDESGVIIDANPAAVDILDRELDSIIGTMSEKHFHHWPDFIDNFRKKNLFRSEVRIFRNGDLKYYDVNYYPIYSNNKSGASVIVSRDITERKIIEERFKYLSVHDQLTGLYNRTYFDEEMKRLSSGRRFPLSVFMIDLDGLKYVNDTMGHSSGDRLITVMSEFLTDEFRQEDMIARIGGDEFVVFLPETDEDTASKIKDRVLEHLAALNESMRDFKLDFSLGVHTANKGEDLFEALKKADKAMYDIKRKKKEG